MNLKQQNGITNCFLTWLISKQCFPNLQNLPGLHPSIFYTCFFLFRGNGLLKGKGGIHPGQFASS